METPTVVVGPCVAVWIYIRHVILVVINAFFSRSLSPLSSDMDHRYISRTNPNYGKVETVLRCPFVTTSTREMTVAFLPILRTRSQAFPTRHPVHCVSNQGSHKGITVEMLLWRDASSFDGAGSVECPL